MDGVHISFDETYHLKKDKPLYSARFDRVQSFHFPPGLAPVKKGQHAFFINTNGEPAFDRKFKDAFGYYGGIATVADKNGFSHINDTGQDIHAKRFLWSGNFQESLCAVQDEERHFYHITKDGHPAYKERYAYVGDYKYGIAVIVNNEGLCTHIDKQGKFIHGKSFLELDAYHKGYAIAKDEQGNFHIDKSGMPLYKERYLKLEPFYNGRAVAIDNAGFKVLIAESGAIVHSIDASNKKA